MVFFQEKACIKELQKELLSKCKSHQTEAKYEQLEYILQNKSAAYLVNERFINIPSQLAVPFHQSLLWVIIFLNEHFKSDFSCMDVLELPSVSDISPQLTEAI